MKPVVLSVLSFGLMFGSAAFAADESSEGLPPVRIAIPVFDDDPANGIEHPLVEFVRTWGPLTGRELVIERFPFKRSLRLAVNGEVDFHFPLIRDPDLDSGELPFAYSSERITTINFVLYSRTGETLDLSQPDKLRLATHSGHANLFSFDLEEDFSVEGSLMKLKSGRIDGYIFADNAADPLIQELGLTGIQRQLYKVYDVHAVLERSDRGDEADEFITQAMIKARQGELSAYAKGIPYSNWQPDELVAAPSRLERAD